MSNEVINPYQTFRDDAGIPLANGTITFNVNNTTTISTIYSDEALTVTQNNPYTLDAYGRIAGDVKYVGVKRLIIKTELGGTVRTLDDVASSEAASAGKSKDFATLASAVASTEIADGDVLNLAERTSGNGGGAFWDVVLSSNVTENTFNIVQCTGVGTLSIELRDWDKGLLQLGADRLGSTDAVPVTQHAVDLLNTAGGGILDVEEGTWLFATKPQTDEVCIKLRPFVSMTGRGDLTEFKIADDLITDGTDGFHVFRNESELIQNVSFTNFKINFNGLNNLYPAGLGGGKCHGIRIKSLDGASTTENILIDNVTFFQNPGAQNIVLSMSDDLSNHPTDCVINNCRFKEFGPAISGNTEITDHSSILGYLLRGKITNNTFSNASLNASFTTTAIECHCIETVITGNTVKNCTVGVLLAGQTTNCTTTVVDNNILKNVDIGVYIWNGVSGGAGQVVEKITISDNVITVSDQATAGDGGIVPGTLEGVMSELTITGNTITQEGGVSANSKNPKAIFLAWAENCLIANNNIFNFAGKGIEVSNSSTSRTMKRIHITGNIIRDIGLGGVASSDYAIQAKGLNASFVAFDISIHSNKITGGFGEAIRIDGYVNGVDVQSNSIKPGTTNPVIFANFNASNIIERNNWAESAGAQPSTGFYINGKVIVNSGASELGSSSSKYIIHGWRKLTTGSTNATPADWVQMRTLTGN